MNFLFPMTNVLLSYSDKKTLLHINKKIGMFLDKIIMNTIKIGQYRNIHDNCMLLKKLWFKKLYFTSYCITSQYIKKY